MNEKGVTKKPKSLKECEKEWELKNMKEGKIMKQKRINKNKTIHIWEWKGLTNRQRKWKKNVKECKVKKCNEENMKERKKLHIQISLHGYRKEIKKKTNRQIECKEGYQGVKRKEYED